MGVAKGFDQALVVAAPLGDREPAHIATAAALGLWLENGSAPDRHRGRVRTDHEAVAARRHRLFLERDLRQSTRARSDLGAFEKRHPSQDLGRAEMEADARPVLERPRRVGEQAQAPRDELRGSETSGCEEPLPARRVVALDVMQRDRRALAGPRLLDLRAVHLHRADARGEPARLDLELVPYADPPAP